MDARLMIPYNFAGVTLLLPEMKIRGSYFIQNKLEMVPRVWEDAKMVEAIEDQGLMGKVSLGEVWRTQPVRKWLWEAGFRLWTPHPGFLCPSHACFGVLARSVTGAGKGVNLRGIQGSRIHYGMRSMKCYITCF